MRVGVVQHDICWEDREATLALVGPRIASLARAGAELVALPEMFAVGFSMDTAKVAEAPGGPTETWLRERAAEHGIWVGGSAPVRTGTGGVRNRFLLAGADGRLFTYDKVKPFTHGGEHEHYEAGEATTTWDLDGFGVTPFVCYDLRFAPLWWDRAPDTDLYLCVASWPSRRAAHWRSLLVARAVENQAPVVGCNRIGEGGGLAYAGGSIMVDALGHVVEDAGTRDAGFIAHVDPTQTAQVRASLPFLADR